MPANIRIPDTNPTIAAIAADEFLDCCGGSGGRVAMGPGGSVIMGVVLGAYFFGDGVAVGVSARG